MKKTILISVALIFFGLAPHAFAEGFVPLAPIPGLTESVTADTEGLAKFFNNLYKYLIGIASALAVIMITWGGLRIATNKDNVSVIMDSKGTIINAILGLILVLSPVLVFTIINPSILNLSINLDPLDTRTTVTPSNSTVVPQPGPQTRYYACSGTDCDAAKSFCQASSAVGGVPQSIVVCQRPNGSIDPNGRIDGWLQSARCVAGESLVVECVHGDAQTIGI